MRDIDGIVLEEDVAASPKWRRSTTEETMSKTRDEHAEIKAAKERLRKFCRPASECKNHHNLERLRRWRDGKQGTTRSVTWAELGRHLRTL
jgi:penicillin V acylase-like amidase (Ntn superfamily)